MTTVRVTSCGQSVSNVGMALMLTFQINFLQNGKLVVMFYFPHLIYQTLNRMEIEIWWLFSIFHLSGTSLTSCQNQLGEHMLSQ